MERDYAIVLSSSEKNQMMITIKIIWYIKYYADCHAYHRHSGDIFSWVTIAFFTELNQVFLP